MTTTEYTDDDFALDDEPVLPPPRPRRRLTPLTGALAAVLLVAVGFIGGVLVQKQAGDDGDGGLPDFAAAMRAGGMPGAAGGGAGAGAAGGMPGGAAGAAGDMGGAAGGPGGAAGSGGAAAGGAGMTVGEVTTVKGDTLYVRDASGNTVKVRAAKGATVTRTADAKPREIRPGEQVVVRGDSRDGTVTASSISAGDGAAGIAAFAGALGGGTGRGASSASGSGGSSGGDAVDQLFDDQDGR
jgi:hypothetical protein